MIIYTPLCSSEPVGYKRRNFEECFHAIAMKASKDLSDSIHKINLVKAHETYCDVYSSEGFLSKKIMYLWRDVILSIVN